MLSQALRTRQHSFISWLHIHRHFNHTSTSTSEKGTQTDDNFRNRTAFIRTVVPIQNLADAWALLRAIESKYGKILEAQFRKVSLQYCLTWLPVVETAILSGLFCRKRISTAHFCCFSRQGIVKTHTGWRSKVLYPSTRYRRPTGRGWVGRNRTSPGQ